MEPSRIQPLRLPRQRLLGRCGAMALVGLALVGCRPDSAPPPAGEDMTLGEMIRPRRPMARPQTTDLEIGRPPLVYQAPQAGAYRVTDLTMRRTLADIVLDEGEIIAIDAQEGIVAGTRTIRPGPLPADHDYGIGWGTRPSTQPTDTTAPQAPTGAGEVAPPRSGD